MDKIDHLTVSEINYKCCVYSLAARDYNKALGWIKSAITHINLHVGTSNPFNLTELYSKIWEYEELSELM